MDSNEVRKLIEKELGNAQDTTGLGVDLIGATEKIVAALVRKKVIKKARKR
jgi:hypothetical protein